MAHLCSGSGIHWRLGDAEGSDGDKTNLTSAEAGRIEGTLLVNGGPLKLDLAFRAWDDNSFARHKADHPALSHWTANRSTGSICDSEPNWNRQLCRRHKAAFPSALVLSVPEDPALPSLAHLKTRRLSLVSLVFKALALLVCACWRSQSSTRHRRCRVRSHPPHEAPSLAARELISRDGRS